MSVNYQEKFEKMLRFVHKVRAAQKRYFETRSTGALNDSKKLERQLDKALETYIKELEDNQLKLL